MKISFEKSPKVGLGEHAPIHVIFDVLEDVERIEIDIFLPAQVALHAGDKRHRVGATPKGTKIVLPLRISVDDSIMGRIIVNAITEQGGIRGNMLPL